MDNKKQPTEHHEPSEENLVQDLKKSLEETINETQYILDHLEKTVETTIKDQSISDSTKKIVDSIKSDIKNSLGEKSSEVMNTIETKKAINNFRLQMDPRKYNGAVFLGLNGIAVKSHGGTDAFGFANAIGVAVDMVRYNFISNLKNKISKIEYNL